MHRRLPLRRIAKLLRKPLLENEEVVNGCGGYGDWVRITKSSLSGPFSNISLLGVRCSNISGKISRGLLETFHPPDTRS